MLIQETNMFFRINKLLFCVKLQLVTAISNVKKKKKKKNQKSSTPDSKGNLGINNDEVV